MILDDGTTCETLGGCPLDAYDALSPLLLDELERACRGLPIGTWAAFRLSRRRLITTVRTGVVTPLGRAVIDLRDQARSRVALAELRSEVRRVS